MNKKLSIFQLVLLSTGGMLGAGWLFSPFYGAQTAGIGVIYSWIITAVLTLIIGLSFAKVCSALPVVGGIYRLMGITHHPNIAGVFLILGWLSYVVYLPLEAQSVVQYLGFWTPAMLRETSSKQIELSWIGIGTAALIILGITWFNTLLITKVARVNNWVSFWKISIPILVAFIVILSFGHWHTMKSQANFAHFNSENVLLAVTSSGLAFAFSGFQNGLILANQVEKPVKALPYSLFAPIIVGFFIYVSLSVSFLATGHLDQNSLTNAAAPLLGLLSLLGINWLFTLLFIDAIIAPLGTTNVYVAVTARILYSLGLKLRPGSFLTQKNRNNSPVAALWINAFIGVIFLFPFPTWKELVNFLSSIVVFAYLAGPISMLVLEKEKSLVDEGFRLPFPQIIGLLGFMCCTWLIYWSGTHNLACLIALLLIVNVAYCFVSSQRPNLIFDLLHNWYLPFYTACLWAVSFLHDRHMIPFPLDNLIVGAIGGGFCSIFVYKRLPLKTIRENIVILKEESSHSR